MKNLNILKIEDTCTGCGSCVSICPKQALTLCYNNEGFYYPILDDTKCIECKACEKACHVINHPTTEEINNSYIPYMLKAKSSDIVKKSSSGGMFSLLANWVMEKGGSVYGARYNYETERLEHCSTDTCSIDELRKSKYIESFMGDTFKYVASDLKHDRYVLFCGTPCQVKGLKTYLDFRKITQDKLLLVRFICHGVPSNKFFTEYKHWEERNKKGKVIHFDFRPKTKGWRTSNLLLNFSNGKTLDELYNCNYYYYYFQNNYLLRSSCYKCTQINDVCGDFTIADFWGIHTYQPQNKENNGLSLILVQTEKASGILEDIREKCDIVEKLPIDAVNYIYKDTKWRKSCAKDRAEMISKVVKHGYMKTVVQKVRRQVIKNKIHYFLSNSWLWKIIKRR